MSITDLAFIDMTGYHLADFPSFLTWIQDQYRTIYGEDVYLEADSQDGQLLAVFAKALYDSAARDASTYNSFSPATGQGVGLSRNVKINGLERRIPTKSTVDVTIIGQAGTTIKDGVAIDTLNQKWSIPLTTIPGGGTIEVTATAQEIGALNAAAHTVNRIFTPTLGWQSVDNSSAATPGQPVETDAELRLRQAASTADPSLTVFDGTIGGVSNLPGVTKVKGYENDTASTDGNGIPSHSIELVVAGGDETQIAQEIALHKTPGTGTAGSKSKTVYDAHGVPILIRFERPTPVIISVEITISVGLGWSSDYEALMAAAVADVINAVQIGGTVMITKLFAPAYLIGTPAGNTFDIITLEIAAGSDPLSDVNIDLAFTEQATCDPTMDVTVIVT